MKKILAGMFFRLVRGYEILALIGLFLFAAIYLTHTDVMTLEYLSAKHIPGYTYSYDYGKGETVISKDNADQFCYKNSGISAFDIYRARVENIPQEEYDRLHVEMGNIPFYEMEKIYQVIQRSFLIPAVLMTIFIPVFFGRLFSDGTIKNIVACGYSKGKIFFASLVMTAILDIALILSSFLIIAGICIWLKWQPPIYLPVLIPTAVISVLLLFTITSVCMSVMFAGAKKTIAFVAGFIMIAVRFYPVSFFCTTLLWMGQASSVSDMDQDVLEQLKKEGRGSLEIRFDLSQFVDKYYLNGEEIRYVWQEENDLPPAVTKPLIALIYLDPFLVDLDYNVYMGFTPYLMYRDGLMAINIASNIFWICCINGLGILVVNKRELHC